MFKMVFSAVLCAGLTLGFILAKPERFRRSSQSELAAQRLTAEAITVIRID
ncbi:hypothetical protein [Celeribacter halophilus]|uniref:hypothetical protein n=1 Tax=Celeribacter halophilus TaxID=576117 RepID=UPI001C09E165|nr:hypothetical protein [Celeribacter halophilus]MBU2888935.1 hypothetical protein [Celeribacter halophilus]